LNPEKKLSAIQLPPIAYPLLPARLILEIDPHHLFSDSTAIRIGILPRLDPGFNTTSD